MFVFKNFARAAALTYFTGIRVMPFEATDIASSLFDTTKVFA